MGSRSKQVERRPKSPVGGQRETSPNAQDRRQSKSSVFAQSAPAPGGRSERHGSSMRRVSFGSRRQELPVSGRQVQPSADPKGKAKSAAAEASLRGRMVKMQDLSCQCRKKFPGKWSGTNHGSHGFKCGAEYNRYLSLMEQCLT